MTFSQDELKLMVGVFKNLNYKYSPTEWTMLISVVQKLESEISAEESEDHGSTDSPTA